MKISVSKLDELERMIQNSNLLSVRNEVKSITAKDVPRFLVARFSNLLKRIGEIKMALKILNPIIFNPMASPEVEEIIEYASCLSRASLEDESIAMLNKIKNYSNPEIQFELAAAQIKKWNYSEAIPLLNEYINSQGQDPYRICVGKINLGAAYLYSNQLQLAENQLHQILPSVQGKGHELLCGYTLLLLTEAALLDRKLEIAEKFLNSSAQKLNNFNHRYGLYFKKWKIIIKMIKESGSKESLFGYEELRKNAAKLRNWNVICDLELFRGVASNNTEAIKHLYYGVPYQGLRNRILFVWGKPLSLELFYDRRIGPKSNEAKEIFDVTTCTDLSTGNSLKAGQTLFRLMRALSSDFYSPFLTTKIFSIVYKNTSYNPFSSSEQVYKAIRRLNDWLKKNKSPLYVESTAEGYRLRSKNPYILRLPLQFSINTSLEGFITKLASCGLVDRFSLKAVVKKLGIPNRTASRLLSDAVASGYLLRQGKGKNVNYSLQQQQSA